MHIEIIKLKHTLYPQISYFGAYLTVEQANLTVERGCSKQCLEVERSVIGGSGLTPKLGLQLGGTPNYFRQIHALDLAIVHQLIGYRPINSQSFTVRLKVLGQSSRSYPPISHSKH